MSKSFKTNSATILTKLFKIYVRPNLKYNTQIWSPYLKKGIIKIESVKQNLPVLYVVVVTYPIHHIMIDWLNLD